MIKVKMIVFWANYPFFCIKYRYSHACFPGAKNYYKLYNFFYLQIDIGYLQVILAALVKVLKKKIVTANLPPVRKKINFEEEALVF